MTVLRIDNVGIVVDDLEAAIAFFVELGLELEDHGANRGHPPRGQHESQARDLARRRDGGADYGAIRHARPKVRAIVADAELTALAGDDAASRCRLGRASSAQPAAPVRG